jgi:type IX secretion system PorP/SprF family membrane protein
MVKSLFIFALVLGISLDAWSQTDPIYAQYLNNPVLINPAYTGLNNTFSASATYRKQWAGFDGSPETFNINAHTSLQDDRMGLGLIILRDKIGSNSNTEINATYSYKLDLGDQSLSFGLQAGMMNFRSDNNDLKPYDPSDPTFFGNINTTKINFGAGAILKSDKYLIGVSAPRMMKAKETIENNEVVLYDQHYYLTGAYAFYLNERIRLKPSVLIRAISGSKPATDVNVTVNLEEKYSAGLFTRNLNTFGALIQMKLSDHYRFGYALEVPSNKSVGTRFISHEFTIGMNLALFSFQDIVSISTF